MEEEAVAAIRTGDIASLSSSAVRVSEMKKKE